MNVFDLHLHTRLFSDCSFIHAEDLIPQAARAGLNGIALTEHGTRWPDKKFDELRRQADAHGLVLLNGQEILASSAREGMEGEFLVFGVRESLTASLTACELVERVHGEGGVIIAAHPYKLSRGGRYRYYGAGDRVYDLHLDGLELCHPDHNETAMRKTQEAMKKLRLPGTGGSDAHKIFAVGCCVTLFHGEIRDENDFLREVRAGNLWAEKRIMAK